MKGKYQIIKGQLVEKFYEVNDSGTITQKVKTREFIQFRFDFKLFQNNENLCYKVMSFKIVSQIYPKILN